MCFRLLLTHHQEIQLCLWDTWYLFFSMDDCLVCRVERNLHTRQSSIQKNKYQVSYKHSCMSWWWAHSSPKHVEIDSYKYTKKKKIVHQFGLFTRCLLVCCWDYYDVLVSLPLSPLNPHHQIPYNFFITYSLLLLLLEGDWHNRSVPEWKREHLRPVGG